MRAALLALSVVAVLLFTTASDNFTRADNTTLGTNWIDPTSEWGISSNQAYQTGIGVNSAAPTWWNPSTNTFGADQFSQVTCAIYNGFQCWTILRMTGSTISNLSGYLCVNDAADGSWKIYRADAGPSYNLLASGSGTTADGDVNYCQIVGTTITFKRNGSTLGSATDATYGSGQPGFASYETFGVSAGRFDDWSGGDLGGGGATYPGAIINAPLRCCQKATR